MVLTWPDGVVVRVLRLRAYGCDRAQQELFLTDEALYKASFVR
jgi:hypothetical protein